MKFLCKRESDDDCKIVVDKIYIKCYNYLFIFEIKFSLYLMDKDNYYLSDKFYQRVFQKINYFWLYKNKKCSFKKAMLHLKLLNDLDLFK